MEGAHIPGPGGEAPDSSEAGLPAGRGQDSAGQPGSGQPGSGQPGAGQDSAGETGAARADAGQAGAGQAGAPAARPAQQGEPVKRGRPRSEEADRAILAAATELLAERGLGGMSMEEVAARAGVGKATVYRRWSSRGALALDAFLAEFEEQQPVPDTGTFRGDLLSALRGWIRSVTRTPAGRMLAGLVAEAQRDPALAAAWRDQVIEPLRVRNTVLVERAIERGEIPSDVDADVVLDMMFGAAYHRLLQGHRPLTDQFAKGVVDLIVAGVGAA